LIRILLLPVLLPGVALAAPLSPLAMACEGCHRPGTGSAEFVALDRSSAVSIEANLKRFRDHPEPASIMARFSSKLSDEDIVRLAAQLSNTPEK
jgi:cytochrome c553